MIEALECDEPRASVGGLRVLKRGETRAFVIEDETKRIEATVRLVLGPDDELVAAPFPGLGSRWQFSWPGALPTYAGLDEHELWPLAIDGGFELDLPSTPARFGVLTIYVPQYVVEGCAGARCDTTGVEGFFVSFDGGVVRNGRSETY